MNIKFERIADLFDDDIVQEMLRYAEPKQCHHNAAIICVEFDDWGCIDYCEGYYAGICGHAFNCYNDYNGNKHYFDVTQELHVLNGLINDSEFIKDAQLVTTFKNGTDAIKKFNMCGESKLLTVERKLK